MADPAVEQPAAETRRPGDRIGPGHRGVRRRSASDRRRAHPGQQYARAGNRGGLRAGEPRLPSGPAREAEGEQTRCKNPYRGGEIRIRRARGVNSLIGCLGLAREIAGTEVCTEPNLPTVADGTGNKKPCQMSDKALILLMERLVAREGLEPPTPGL
jgi:hypothetical protein